MRALLFIPLLSSACILGEAWPERYAVELCATAFTCVEGEDLSTNADWSDEQACVDDVASVVRLDPKYEGFQNGDCTWEGDAATDCLQELSDLRGSDSCDGKMTYAELLVDGVSPRCAVVYACEL